jgi:hypothetical protein
MDRFLDDRSVEGLAPGEILKIGSRQASWSRERFDVRTDDVEDSCLARHTEEWLDPTARPLAQVALQRQGRG